MNNGEYENSVFINCPFDNDYLELLRAIVFAVVYFNFYPRLSSERSDSGEMRINKICEMINNSKYSIHDLSRLQSKKKNEYYRLNMPFELGVDYGCRNFSSEAHKEKKFLVLEKELHRFRIALSDFSGFDIKKHDNNPAILVGVIRDWFIENEGIDDAISGTALWYKFADFWKYLYDELKPLGFSEEEIKNLPIKEFIKHIHKWIEIQE